MATPDRISGEAGDNPPRRAGEERSDDEAELNGWVLRLVEAKGDASAAQVGQEAVAGLVAALFPRLRRVAEFRAVPGVDPDDLVQDALVRMLPKLLDFVPTDREAPFRQLAGWAGRVVANIAAERSRRAASRRRHEELAAARSPSSMGDDPVDPGPDPLDVAAEVDLVEQIRRALTRLPLEEQVAIRLHYLEGRPWRVIQELLRRSSEGASRQLARRGLRRLARELRGLLDDADDARQT